MLDLDNINILLTRQPNKAKKLKTHIERLGGRCISLPLFDIESLLTPASLALLQQDLFRATLIICTSQNAVDPLLCELNIPPTALWATVGPATADIMLAHGIKAVIYPDQPPFDSQALVRQLKLSSINLANQYIIVLTGLDGNDWLIRELEELNATVKVWHLYRRVLPDLTVEDVRAAFACGIDLIFITCVTSLTNLITLTSKAGLDVYEFPILVCSERIHIRARQDGFKYVYQAKSVDDADVIGSMLAFCASERV